MRRCCPSAHTLHRTPLHRSPHHHPPSTCRRGQKRPDSEAGEGRGSSMQQQAAHVHGYTFLTAFCPHAIVNREPSKPLQGDRRREVCAADSPSVKWRRAVRQFEISVNAHPLFIPELCSRFCRVWSKCPATTSRLSCLGRGVSGRRL